MIQVLALTDGDRDKFADSVSSFKKNLKTSDRFEWVVYTTAPDDEFRDWVMKNFPWISEVKYGRYQLREAWMSINPNADYIIQFSDTQVLSEEFDVDVAVNLIDDRPYLAQLVFFDLEVDGETVKDAKGREWTEHSTGWSMLPSLYRTALTEIGWPLGKARESRFTAKLLRNSKSWRFACLNA